MAESFFSRFPAPPCAELLGWELIAEYPDKGRIEIAFHPTAQMLNPRGTVQGGFVAAMLDDTMGPALVSMTGGAEVPASIDLNVSFLKPVMPGRVVGKGRVVGRGRSVRASIVRARRLTSSLSRCSRLPSLSWVASCRL